MQCSLPTSRKAHNCPTVSACVRAIVGIDERNQFIDELRFKHLDARHGASRGSLHVFAILIRVWKDHDRGWNQLQIADQLWIIYYFTVLGCPRTNTMPG